MENFHLLTGWQQEKEAGIHISPHSHRYHELVYYCQGDGMTTIGENRLHFSPRSYALIAPEVPHDESHSIDGNVICLGFEAALSLPSTLYPDADGAVYRIAKAIVTEIYQQHYGYRQMLQAKLAELLVILNRTGNEISTPKSFEYVINFIRENYHEKILLSDLARQLNLSYDYFQHRFKHLTGLSPQQFLLKTRMDAAKELLSASCISCTEIAYRCGFSNSAQFSMQFKRENGITPLAYRQQN